MNFNKLGSIGKLAGNFTGSMGQLDMLVKAAKGLLCLPVVLSKFKLADIKNLLKGVGAIAAGLVANIAISVAEAITDRINSLAKTIANVIRKKAQQQTVNIQPKALDLKKFHFNTQNCAVHAANFLNCVMTIVANKITAAVLSKLNNPLRKFDSKLAKLQKDISVNAFQAGGLMDQHVGRHLKFAEKLTKQISILTR